MSTTSENNKRVAKNTIILYVRMLVLMVVNLYSSRIVLHELGVEDFGIYNIIGGIVMMFTFLNSTMSSATSRFLTFELGRENISKLKETFKVSFLLHIFVALLIFFIAETIGLWLVNYKLVIPEERMYAANIIYQISIFTILIKTIQVPFNASIIANEKMSVYAYTEIFNGSLMILLISLMQFVNYDKLILYASIMLILAIVVFFIYSIYCLKNFKECGYGLSFNFHIMRPMLMFSGMDFYGNMCVMVRTQGVNILLNMFFGPVINAANGIATQVQSALMTLSNNVIIAFRPQIIKNYASAKLDIMEQQINISSVIVFFLYSFIAVPLIFEMPYVLSIWLIDFPIETINITRICIITCWLGCLNSILQIPIHATGHIKTLSLVGGSIYLLTLPISYIFLKVFPFSFVAYVVMFFLMVVLLAFTSYVLKSKCNVFSLRKYWVRNILPVCLCVFVSSVLTLIVKCSFEEGLIRLIIVCLSYLLCSIILFPFILLSKDQRIMLKKKLIQKIK